MPNSNETPVERIERLIGEVLEIVPNYTPARGRFNSVPQLGYQARNPGNWQVEFLEVLDAQHLSTLRPDTADIVRLVEFVNSLTMVDPIALTYEWLGGSPRVVPTSTLSTILGYALFEMLVRRLWQGRRGANSLDKLLSRFESASRIGDLADDLRSLNDRMSYEELGRERDLYWRLMRGRNQLSHGEVIRTFEGEGSLLVLLIDLVVLHVMNRELQGTAS